MRKHVLLAGVLLLALVPHAQAEPEVWTCDADAPTLCVSPTFAWDRYATEWGISSCVELGCVPFTGAVTVLVDRPATGEVAGRATCEFRQGVRTFCSDQMPTHVVGAVRLRTTLAPTTFGAGPFGHYVASITLDRGVQVAQYTFDAQRGCLNTVPQFTRCEVGHEGVADVACVGAACAVTFDAGAWGQGVVRGTGKSVAMSVDGAGFPQTVCSSTGTSRLVSCDAVRIVFITIPEGPYECGAAPLVVRTSFFYEAGGTTHLTKPFYVCRDATGAPGFWLL